MQFDRSPVVYLQNLTDGLHTQEETLEVRLPEGMPDIGSVLGAWGQVITRGKEWDADSAALSCGVMVWVLYVPEDGQSVRSVEAWIPISVKWNLPETGQDGKFLVDCRLKNVDARSLSARKLMVRATLCASAQVWIQGYEQVAEPGELPKDIEQLSATYPMLLPMELGEKAFMIEEQLSPPTGGRKPEKLLYYCLQPEISDKKIMADKVVFRGNAQLHLLYRGADEHLYSWDCELPFSQYGDLEGEYGQEASVTVLPCVTSLELSLEESGELLLKAGLVGQYLVCDRITVTLVQDAYSPHRPLTLIEEKLCLPSVLDQIAQTLQSEQSLQADAQEIVDVTFYPVQGQAKTTATGMEVPISGQYQVLYYDSEGMLFSRQIPWTSAWNVAAAENAAVCTRVFSAGKPQGNVGAGTVNLRAELGINSMVLATEGIPMLTGMEMGEPEKPDPNRPGLVLCRKGNRRLWDVAKATGSTVETIMRTNQLDTEPEADRVLLIPIQ